MKLPHFIVGLLFDVVDWLVLGFMPILGDLVDLAAAAYFTHVLGPVGLTSALELVPFADFLPTNILLGLYADYLERPLSWTPAWRK